MRLSMECCILTVNTGWSFWTEIFCQVYTSQVCGKTKLGWMSGPVHFHLISWIFYKFKILCASGPLQDHKDHHFFGRPLLSYVVLIRTSWEPWPCLSIKLYINDSFDVFHSSLHVRRQIIGLIWPNVGFWHKIAVLP